MASKSLIKPKEVRVVMEVARSATCPDKQLTTTRCVMVGEVGAQNRKGDI